MYTLINLCIFLSITCHFHAYGTDKYTDENRPYEFGFTIDGEQHRHEKKDENGIIMGEFGFITADGVYHVTVYATDENGNFKILSMKNIRVKPYPTSPGVGERKNAPISIKDSKYAINSSPSTGGRQGHSLFLSPPQQVPSNNKQEVTVKNDVEVVRSCSHCKVPTTTVAPKIITTTERKQISQNVFAEPEFSLKTPFMNQFSSQNSESNIPSSISLDSNQQIYAKDDKSSLDQSIYNTQNTVNQQPNVVNEPLVPKTDQFIFDNNVNKLTNIVNSNINSDYQPNLLSRQNKPQNFNPELNHPGSFIEETNIKRFPDQPALNQLNLPNNNHQVSTIVNNYTPFSNTGQPNSLRSPEKPSGSINYEQDQNIFQAGSPPSISNGYRHPKSFEEILQSASPNQLESSQPGVNQFPGKPVLFAAQMQVVDKNTDIYHKNPGELEGLPKGLNSGDMADLLYTFNYTVGFHGHHEKGYTNGVKIGYYFVTGRNGVRTRVDYVADQNGFQPKITQEVLDILSDEVPKPETEKDEKYGLKGYEFKWLYYPVDSRKR